MRSSSAELFDLGAEACRTGEKGKEVSRQMIRRLYLSIRMAYVLGVDWHAVTETEHRHPSEPVLRGDQQQRVAIHVPAARFGMMRLQS